LLLLLEAGSVQTKIENFPPPPAAAPVTHLGDSLPQVCVSLEVVQLKQTSKASSITVNSVHLVEDKVFAHFSNEEKVERRRWVLDTSATNHMTGCKSTFTDIDLNIQGTVKFGDGSMVHIKGMGTVVFCCMNSEHRAFTGVYLIPKLTTNIISVG
jgi:hypothetical protein